MTPTQLKALEAAKEALIGHGAECKDVNDALALIDAALAEQPAQQEPVAWMYVNQDGECEDIGYGNTYLAGHEGCTPLYTAPPQRTWVGLTDEEIDAIWDAVITPSNHVREFVRAIEAAHGIKEQG